MQILEVAVHLLERKTKRKEALCHVGGKMACEPLAAHRGDFDGIGVNRGLDSLQRQRLPPRAQRRRTPAQIIGEGAADLRQRRLEPRDDVLG